MNNFRNVEWLTSRNKTTISAIDNYLFYSNKKTSDNKTYWVCSNENCNAKALSLDHQILEVYNTHNHSDDIFAIIKMKFKKELTNNVSSEPFVGSHTIYEKTKLSFLRLYNSTPDAIINIPSYLSVSSFIFR
ncbi:hypothetical protein DMUE_2558 [Dictyocoela muelleri]|nr:hypothetical protein DMUE_2558 [Dictyocoela muelleri]